MSTWILGGRKLYEIFHSNFKGVFPSPRSIEAKLDKFDACLTEGVLGISRLKDYLVTNRLPQIVSISEDATAIVGRREYHAKTNSVIGFSLPLSSTGLPNPEMSVVKKAEDIVTIFRKFQRATVVMVVMVQPLADKVPPLRLCSFGSDNKFTSDDVKRRLHFIENELKKSGIEVLTYSSDGDTRELKMMRQKLELGVQRSQSAGNSYYENVAVNLLLTLIILDLDQIERPTVCLKTRWKWFHTAIVSSSIPVQDTIHEGAKLRTRLLKREKFLILGDKIASCTFLDALLTSVTKDKHLLREGDLSLKDKMNYCAVERLCQPHVRVLLDEHVPGHNLLTKQ